METRTIFTLKDGYTVTGLRISMFGGQWSVMFDTWSPNGHFAGSFMAFAKDDGTANGIAFDKESYDVKKKEIDQGGYIKKERLEEAADALDRALTNSEEIRERASEVTGLLHETLNEIQED